MEFTIGQRWISHTESQLGLGIINQINGRHISVGFPAVNEERMYAWDNAPLSRIIYNVDEEIVTIDEEKIIVTAVKQRDGLLVYTGVDEKGNIHTLDEIELNPFLKFSTPEQRLFSGQFDKLSAFKLKIDTLNHLSRLAQSKVRGLLGSRTSHLAHQVYIAAEVAERHAPRVMLADEVGLGKTIEAGMILHYQLHTARAARILIVVPDALIYQWFVEMLRRFNLFFAIFDQSRFAAMQMEPGEDASFDQKIDTNTDNAGNFFESEQLIICSLDFLLKNSNAFSQACATHWDLLVVDEAHHLQWSPSSVSPEYQCIEQLSLQSKGLLLLTATPEQVGIDSHFARLRLLDPSRFYDLEAFKKEEAGYQPLITLVKNLLSYRLEFATDILSNDLKLQVEQFLNEEAPSDINEIVNKLLDRHGTGRVLFRNTRAAIGGFPQRRLHYYPLAQPLIYSNKESCITNLYPEITIENNEWLKHDPRIKWLEATLIKLRPEKVLVICAKATTAVALEQYFQLNAGIRCTSFHEGLSIIERDRAAAYFSEQENGAQTLICSEIGSEGRNFQFAHHLVLFDLPLNPDLLEQRIGRLDRIGQRHTIEIHVPFIENSAQEILFRWYHEGINLFVESCSVGFSIFTAFKNQLTALLDSTSPNHTALHQLIEETKAYTAQLRHLLKEGRDPLLEMNSCNKPKAQELIAIIETEENSLELESYMANVFHVYGIEHEYHSEFAEILRPTEHMLTGHFPMLGDDDMVVTYSRTKALFREDMEFLSWEHPMVCESMEMILGSESGNAALATISVKGLQTGTLLLETFYTVNCMAPKNLQLERFLPLKPIRVLMDLSGKNLSEILDYPRLNNMCEKIQRHTANAIINQVRSDIETMLKNCNLVAEEQVHAVINHARSLMNENLLAEINRLTFLQKNNASIRDDEIAFFKQQIISSEYYLSHASLKLEALRVVINK